jgi:hypothetical protein
MLILIELRMFPLHRSKVELDRENIYNYNVNNNSTPLNSQNSEAFIITSSKPSWTFYGFCISRKNGRWARSQRTTYFCSYLPVSYTNRSRLHRILTFLERLGSPTEILLCEVGNCAIFTHFLSVIRSTIGLSRLIPLI